MSNDVMRLALEALRYSFPADGSKYEKELEEKHREAIKALEEALKQERGESTAWPCEIETADFEKDTITLKMQSNDYKVSAGQHWLSTSPPDAKQQLLIPSNSTELEKQEQVEPVEFLANGVRFKLNFDSKGRVSSLWNYLSELDGRWVALVAAEDDCHLKLSAPQSQQNPSNQLVGALAHTPEADFWRWWEPYELKDCWRLELVARDAWMAAKENK